MLRSMHPNILSIRQTFRFVRSVGISARGISRIFGILTRDISPSTRISSPGISPFTDLSTRSMFGLSTRVGIYKHLKGRGPVVGPVGPIVKRNNFIRRHICNIQNSGEQPAGSQANTKIKHLHVLDKGRKLHVSWDDGKESRFHGVWLRFNCGCIQCRDPNINVGILCYHDIPLTLTIKSAIQTGNEEITVEYKEDNHKVVFSSPWLRDMCYSNESLRKRRDAMKPDFHIQEAIPEVMYDEVAASSQGLYKWLRLINEHGLCILKQVPTTKDMLKCVIEKIGNIQSTLFGGMYELYVKDEPIDLAYSSSGLQVHTDLPSYECPPGIQFLHCLKFDKSIKGGETVFVDLVHVAELFRTEHPHEFHTLTTIPCPFQRIQDKRGHFVHIEQRRPPIELNKEGDIIAIRWSPTYIGVPYLDEEDVEPFYKAFQLFARAIHNYPYKKLMTWTPGDLIAFNNRRFGHGRNPFKISKGERYLQGGYLNIDDYRSKLMILAKQFGDTRPVKSVFNSNWL